MSRSGQRRRLGRFALVGLVVLLLVVGGATWSLGWVDHWRGHDRVAATPPPLPLSVHPPSPSPAPAIAAPSDGTLKPEAVRRVLRRGLTAALGDHVLAAVAGTTGAAVASRGSGVATPASTNKLLTAATVLTLDGPEKRFATRVVAGTGHRIVLVGGGDPLLAARPDKGYPQAADLTTLARETAAALRQRGTHRVRLQYDAGLFTGPAVNPSWPPSYISEGVVAPITALWADEGRTHGGDGRVADPAADAARTFANALTAAGIGVAGSPSAATAPAGATLLAQVQSPPLREIVDHVLETSDNEGAEVLAHQAGLAAGTGGSFAGGVEAVTTTLTKLGVDTTGLTLHDGSGLSRADRLSATTLVQVLQKAATQARLAPIVSALPVAAFSGSLLERYDDHADAGRGVVRAKTGTLTGVDALAGYTRDADGSPVVFAVVADRVDVPDTLKARDALDALASALTTCRCG
ncbi:D-alanyl-D-alanine carboxypeptidase/D-alanyl-D-alanine-endopeptidase [Nocardioides sp. BP30]|uniref:D-alanyl-D-alanine carboxypeptidase/D-alanyl-D-alanine endopeptidase n=1 Tax=Nocardioides sp. BP30 TaxID=3036374 RepID=UPI0024690655|nr:D-alanyl-D-alanine carboxypeptidase/D-alanyl-D-alanine-endopeptidase [Nocardioides sp. BP30]WGL52867.1 D-alanyl-D-alanine carboxypeptidase/D-alanyl-D-alanine-endopeptidase [Nocardioides sp. BP30]